MKFDFPRRMAAIAVMALGGQACTVESELEHDGPADGAGTGRSALPISTTNGLSFNGLAINGAAANGLAVNGLAVNGIGPNGLAVNGIGVNGLALNGLAVNGIAVNGIAANGIAVNGLAVNGFAVNGIGVNGLYVNGIGVNGLYVNGIAVNGIAANGLYVNGLAVNGLYVNGIAVNGGIAMNGLYVNGIAVNGVALNGIAVNGSAAGPALQVGLANGTLGDLTTGAGSQASEFRDRVMPYLAFCALPPSNSGRDPASCATDPGCVTIKDATGASVYYWGSQGHAPEWKSGPMSTAGSDLVEGCLKAACAAGGSSCQQGMALNSQQEAALASLLRYLVSCALPAPAASNYTSRTQCDADPGCVTIRNSAGVDVFYYGAIDLARSWKSAPLDDVGQQKVSACLAARTNANAETVQISMRGLGLSVSGTERARFRRHEGGFYGNLFASAPSIHTCEVQGGEMAGRVCADGECGFTAHGACKSACTSPAADGTFTSCNGYGHVLNTFLPFGDRASSSEDNVCAIQPDGRAYCWGENSEGGVGDGTTIDRTSTAPVVPLPIDYPVVQVATACGTSFARKSNGELWAWGGNLNGVIGDGTTVNRLAPVRPVFPAAAQNSIIDIYPTCIGATCALSASGATYCWGDNHYGHVGNGSTGGVFTTPQKVKYFEDVLQLSTSHAGVCALRSNGSVWCWGGGSSGWLGNGGTSSSVANAVPVTGLQSDVVQISSGDHYFSCAVKADGTLWCWGQNTYGAIGDGTTTNRTTPVQPKLASGALFADVAEVEAGYQSACARRKDGTVWCWGANDFGQIGNGTSSKKAVVYPTQVAAVGNAAVSLRAGYKNACAMLRDGKELCWGRNSNGQLGDKTTTTRATPVRMTMFVNPGNLACDYGESTTIAGEAAECQEPEVCNDLYDNDGDGGSDCADPSCAGEATCGGM